MFKKRFNKKWKILFPIETANRELHYKTIISCYLAKKGFECYIGSKNDIYALFEKLSPFIYFDKGYHSGVSENLYKRIRENSGFIFNLDEEGGIDYLDSKTLLSRYNDDLFKFTDVVFLWGKKQFEILKKNNRNFQNNLVVISGHPRFELLKSNYDFLYSNNSKFLRDKYKGFILINTNMSIGNNIKGKEFILKNYGERKKGYLNKLIEYDLEKVKFIIEFVKQLASVTSKKIIFRPHPEEDVNYYKKCFKHLKNVEIINSGSSINWIKACDVLVHTDCTTAIEASYVGKKPISVLPYFDDNLTSFLPVKVSNSFYQIDTAISEVIKINKKYVTNFDNLSDRDLSDYFSLELNSLDVIINEVIKFSKEQNVINYKSISIIDKFLFYISALLEEFFIIFSGKKQRIFKNQKFGEFSYLNISRIIRVAKHKLELEDLKIEKISKNLVKIL